MARHRALMAASLATGASSVTRYFGNGCYWARQNLFVESFEQALLARSADEITSVAGYAGSTRTGDGLLCYHNEQSVADYGALGHAEAVQLDVPEEWLEAAFGVYFGSFQELSKGIWDRPDFYDSGSEYRSIIGVPGGTSNGAVMSAMRQANVPNMSLVAGLGSDEDTFLTNKVLVMDSEAFPFVQAELCMQFRDDTQVKFPEAYHDLKNASQEQGRVVATDCPANFVCGPDKSPAALTV
jgi:peptide methionine sulfoxide reductase MsrA